MLKKVLFLFNESAGISSPSAARQKIYQIIRELTLLGCAVTVFPIIPSRQLGSEDIIRRILEENQNDPTAFPFDVIACAGGDGTLNHLINALMNEGLKVPIGYFPNGSTNDFSKNLNGESTVEDLCRAIAEGNPFAYDIGRIENKYFNYVAGFGAFTEVSYSTDQDIKNVLGYGAYILSALGSLADSIGYKVSCTITHDDGVEEGEFLFCGVTNTTSVAGVKSPVLSKAELNDGEFEVLLIRAPRNLMDINDIAVVLASGSTEHECVRCFKTKHVHFSCERPVDWTIDGEFGGSLKEADIRVYHEAVSIMI